jgi:hypothetical protein
MRFIFRGKQRLHAHARLMRGPEPEILERLRDDQTMVIDVRQLELVEI